MMKGQLHYENEHVLHEQHLPQFFPSYRLSLLRRMRSELKGENMHGLLFATGLLRNVIHSRG